ncbi:HEAT repeat domain-containing protein [Nostoc sp. FACHB-87]|uniref:HEAT repeat domain-containing protein n=1 Tax=Nostocaceae TaxID=1162 RepID=UPI00168331ED|nr:MULTISPECIES: HEAT repeat domain-containing protein [Nostocaceae]MBD2458857.1 HEAT repeat domain-containing protein [Nostoc sp. FACHB-87]MBD2479902.1 HEAT repeat domain-containing protein [Anabaena sp. FACHB-83]
MPEDSGKFADKIGAYAGSGGTVNINHLTVNASDSSEVTSFTLADWSEICREIITERRKLTTNPLTSSTEGVALQVDDVYVPLGLVERTKQPKPQGDVSPEQGSELYKETEVTKTFKHDAFLEEVLRQQNTPKSQGKRIAIIGEPGAGKTTLLQQIANWVFCEIPQSVVIWVSLADLRGKELKAYLLETWLTQVAEKLGKAEATNQLKEDFVALFYQKNVWLLLDGLDEMSASNPLEAIAPQFGGVGCIAQARIVLTCRINLWDGNTHKLDNFDIYRTLDFDYPEQVEEFIAKWFAKTEIPETGQQLCTALKAQGKERIQDLVKNPLRLTLLCLNWQSGDGKLPDTQAGLYQQFVDDFDKWKKTELAITSRQRQQLNIKLGELAKAAIDKEATRFRLQQDFVKRFLGDADDKKSLLKLALNRGWLNQVGIDTNRKPVYAFFHASFQEYFAAKAIDDWRFFLNHVPHNPAQGTYRIFEPQWKQTILLWLGREEQQLKQQKQEFIDALVSFKDGCGKWNRKDVDKGFYEYRAYFLAAVGIAEFKDCSQADEIVAQIIKWDFGYSSKKQNWVKFLKPIQYEARSALQETERIRAVAPLEQVLQSKILDDDTRLDAADRLGEIDPRNETMIASLVQVLKSTSADYHTRQKEAWSKDLLFDSVPASDSLTRIGKDNQAVIAALVKLVQSTTADEDTRSEAASILGEIGIDNATAIIALVQLLQSPDVSESTRSSLWTSLWKISQYDETSIAALVQLLQSTDVSDSISSDYLSYHSETSSTGYETIIAALVQLLKSLDVSDYTRIEVAEFLQKIDPGNETVISALEQMLQSTNLDEDTRISVAGSLGEIDPGNKNAIAALVQLLQSKDEHFSSWWVAERLGKIDPGNEVAISTFVKLVLSLDVDDKNYNVAINNLESIYPPGDETLIPALLQVLQSTRADNEIIRLVVNSLEKIGKGNETVIAALVQVLQSTTLPDNNRYWSAYSLEKIDPGNPIVIAALVQVLQSTTLPDDTRWSAANSLEKIDPGNPIVIAALVQVLQSTTADDLKYHYRRLAESTLAKIGMGNEKVITALVQLLESTTKDDKTLSLAVSILGRISPGNPIAIAALVQLLQSTTLDDETRWRAADSLGTIDPDNKIAIAALVQLLQSTTLDDDTRWKAADSLGTIDPDNKIAIAALVQLLQSTTLDDETRWRAADSLGTIDPGNKVAIAALVQLLQSTTLDEDTREEVVESLETIGTGNEFAISSLEQLLQSKILDDNTYKQVAESLGRIDPGNKVAIASLEQWLQSTSVHDRNRIYAAQDLWEIDPGNKIAIASLVDVLQSTTVNDDIRRLAVYRLKKIGTGNEFAIAALIQLLQSTTLDDDTRKWVAKSLKEIGTGHDFAISALVQLMQSKTLDKKIRLWAKDSLEKIAIGNQTAISALEKVLKSIPVNNSIDNDRTRWLAADSLWKIDPGNQEAILALVYVLQTSVNKYPPRRAAESLKKYLQNNEDRFQAVKALGSYWQLDGEYYNLAWECAQNMPYPDFYQAWHQHNIVTRTMQSFKQILFPTII